jgi:hypothetical protein
VDTALSAPELAEQLASGAGGTVEPRATAAADHVVLK